MEGKREIKEKKNRGIVALSNKKEKKKKNRVLLIYIITEEPSVVELLGLSMLTKPRGEALRTLPGDPNLEVLQQPTLGKLLGLSMGTQILGC